jgi:putative Mg2+ transporter-C (MgtC) family protein
MPLTLEWPEIVLRLALTVAAGVLIGLERDTHGRPAGLRTTLLVCLAAAIAMIQVNLMLAVAGKAPDSFVTLDLMRLPLGILTGVGFIGAGAILRKDDRILGVTTAATLWSVTVIGLCFGGGQIGLGIAATALVLIVLSALKYLEAYLSREHRAVLILTAVAEPPAEELRRLLAAAGMRIARRNIAFSTEPKQVRLELTLQWRSREKDHHPPTFLAALAERSGMLNLQWQMQDEER